MRQLLLLSLLVSAAACNAGKSTAPASTVINVRVMDEVGAPVARTPVRVMVSPTTRVDAATRNDGTVDIGVDAGVYQVWVIPRDGYISGAESLLKTVTVNASEKTIVDFTVHRAGGNTTDPPAWANPP
jgi:hypothetical protein